MFVSSVVAVDTFPSLPAVLLKFIQVYPELRDSLWTLDEDGEVSGTVMLMLGSLMMRGALYPTPQAPSSCTSTPNTTITTTTQQQQQTNLLQNIIKSSSNITTSSSSCSLITTSSSKQSSSCITATTTPMCTEYTSTTTNNTSNNNINNDNVDESCSGDKEEPCDTSWVLFVGLLLALLAGWWDYCRVVWHTTAATTVTKHFCFIALL